MSRLIDLVHRSALRSRAAGQQEVGSSVQVFEVADLTIPAGTLWRSEAYLLHSLDLEDSNGITWAFYLETVAPLPAGHVLRLDLGDSRNSHDSNDPISTPLSPGDTTALTSGYDTFWNLRSHFLDPPVAFTGYVQIVAAGPGDNPTTTDITIVRARAAFQVI